MRSREKEGAGRERDRAVVCKEHGERCSFVCVYRSCAQAFTLGCAKCRKEHAQHPNRLLSLGEFHGM